MGLHQAERRKGYGREALALFTDWLFEHMGAQVLEAGTDEANHAMRSVFGHVGWRADGTLTEIGRDWIMYRITRPQWQARKNQEKSINSLALLSERPVVPPSPQPPQMLFRDANAWEFVSIQG
jgi:hypothetical protein